MPINNTTCVTTEGVKVIDDAAERIAVAAGHNPDAPPERVYRVVFHQLGKVELVVGEMKTGWVTDLNVTLNCDRADAIKFIESFDFRPARNLMANEDAVIQADKDLEKDIANLANPELDYYMSPSAVYLLSFDTLPRNT